MLQIPNTHSEKLLRLYKRAKEPKLIRIYNLLFLNSKGHTITQLADMFDMNQETVRTCIKKYLEHQQVGDADRSGRPRRLTKEIVEELCRIVDENNPENEGYNLAAWDCRELKIWLLDKHDINVGIDTIRRELKANGFRYVKTNHKLVNANEQKRKEFLKQLSKAVKRTNHVFFEDEIKTKLIPRKGYVWTREKKAFIPNNNSQKKTYTVSAVNPFKAKTVTIHNEKFNAEVFEQFLKKLLKHNKGNIVLVLDNHKAHHAKDLKPFLEKHARLKLLFLPAYSPDLNPQEEIWKYLRQKLLNNKLYETVEDMANAITHFIENLPRGTIQTLANPTYLIDPG